MFWLFSCNGVGISAGVSYLGGFYFWVKRRLTAALPDGSTAPAAGSVPLLHHVSISITFPAETVEVAQCLSTFYFILRHFISVFSTRCLRAS